LVEQCLLPLELLQRVGFVRSRKVDANAGHRATRRARIGARAVYRIPRLLKLLNAKAQIHVAVGGTLSNLLAEERAAGRTDCGSRNAEPAPRQPPDDRQRQLWI
jgi:hypothetical protein